MREIKFRAWDERTKIMWDAGVCDGYTLEELKSQNSTRPYVLMQYTGLKDKNGVEIYEGDIVKMHQFLFDGHEVETECVGVIGYLETSAAFSLAKIRNDFVESHTGIKAGEYETPLADFYGLHEESFEVIGNIHQNPELLK